jgi:uncharacterized membrane protein (DUF2068 family)
MHTSPTIRAVALFEGAKGALVLLAGFGVLSFIHRDLQHAAEVLVHHMHLNPAKHYPQIFIDAAGRVGNMRIWMLVAGAAGYSLVRFVEAYGLWRERAWAEWFAAVSGAVYIPFELHRFWRHHTWLPAAAFVINVAVVGVMVYALLRRRAERERAERRDSEAREER